MLFTFFLISPAAYGLCSSPSGVEGQIQYVTSTMQYCDGSAWVSMNVSNTAASCSVAGALNYSSGDIRYCDGSTWISMNGPTTIGSCSGTSAGTTNWSSVNDRMEWCDGTNWKTMKAGTGGGSAVTVPGDYLAVTTLTSPYLIVYDTDDWSVVSIGSLPTNAARGVDFSTAGNLLAVSTSGTRSLWLYNTSDFSLLSSPQGSGNGVGVAFTNDDDFMVAGDLDSPEKYDVYDTDDWSIVPEADTNDVTENYTKLKHGNDTGGDSILLSGAATATYTTTSFDGFMTAVPGDPTITDIESLHSVKAQSSTDSNSYLWMQDTYSLPPMLSEDPTSAVQDVEFSPDAKFMALAVDSSPYVMIYNVSDWTKVADPVQLPTGPAKSVSFSKNGAVLAVAHANAPYLTMYETTTFTKLVGPSTLPSSVPTHLVFRRSTVGSCEWQPEGFNSYPFSTWWDMYNKATMNTTIVSEGSGALELDGSTGGGTSLSKWANFTSCTTSLKVKMRVKSVSTAPALCEVRLNNFDGSEIYATATRTRSTADTAYQSYTISMLSPAPGQITIVAQGGVCLFDELILQ